MISRDVIIWRLYFLYRIDVDGDVDRFVVVVAFERFQLRFYDFLDPHRVVISIKLDENLFYVLILNPRNDRVFRSKEIVLEDRTQLLGEKLGCDIELIGVSMT